MAEPKIMRWTRDGFLQFAWNPHETIEKLLLTPAVRERLTHLATVFLSGREQFHAARLPWRTGLFLFGPSGSGKSAATRALARALNWDHVTIPAHEIIDSHLFERALADAVSQRSRVIVLDQVDEMIKHMDNSVFFNLLDHALERAEGTLWAATTRHAEDTPKTQLIRPGRFEERVRMDNPPPLLRRELLGSFLGEYFSSERPEPVQSPPPPLMPPLPIEGEDGVLAEAPPLPVVPLEPEKPMSEMDWLVQNTEGLAFSHFEEMRQVVARLKIEGREADTKMEVRSYVLDQVIGQDRFGGASDIADELERRVKQVDPRVLLASLDMTDVFRRLMDKVIADAAEESKLEQASGEGPK